MSNSQAAFVHHFVLTRRRRSTNLAKVSQPTSSLENSTYNLKSRRCGSFTWILTLLQQFDMASPADGVQDAPLNPARGGNMSREQARLELKIIVESDRTGAARRFHDWHSRHDRGLDGMSVENATEILQELGRSIAHSPSSHALWRSTQQALRTIKAWQWCWSQKAWKDIPTRMANLPKSQSLAALAYLDVENRHIPITISRQFREADLHWYPVRGPPTAWWHGAELDDDQWCSQHMHQGPSTQIALYFDVGRFLELLRLVFSAPIVAIAASSSSESSDDGPDSSSESESDSEADVRKTKKMPMKKKKRRSMHKSKGKRRSKGRKRENEKRRSKTDRRSKRRKTCRT